MTVLLCYEASERHCLLHKLQWQVFVKVVRSCWAARSECMQRTSAVRPCHLDSEPMMCLCTVALQLTWLSGTCSQESMLILIPSRSFLTTSEAQMGMANWALSLSELTIQDVFRDETILHSLKVAQPTQSALSQEIACWGDWYKIEHQRLWHDLARRSRILRKLLKWNMVSLFSCPK